MLAFILGLVFKRALVYIFGVVSSSLFLPAGPFVAGDDRSESPRLLTPEPVRAVETTDRPSPLPSAPFTPWKTPNSALTSSHNRSYHGYFACRFTLPEVVRLLLEGCQICHLSPKLSEVRFPLKLSIKISNGLRYA